MSNWNAKIIDEFRSNEGKVGGVFDGAPLLLLHHVGARSGTERVTPLMYQALDEGYAVFASKAGAEQNPAWFHNVMANPRTTVEVGAQTVRVVARQAAGEEHHTIWAKQKNRWRQFAEYELKTSRSLIPVVVLAKA